MAGIKKNSFDSIKKKFSKEAEYKPDSFLDLGDAFLDATGLPGPAIGHINMLLGHSDTGKTTALVKAAVDAQKKGIVPVFIITEQKWNWDHAQLMGFDKSGDYIFNSDFEYIEQITDFINEVLDAQDKGEIESDLLFLWDSVGSIPCDMSIEQGKNNPMWNAGAMATQFGNFINQKIPLSRKESSQFTNTFFVINKTGVQPALTPMSQPRMTNKGGNTMYWDASIVITFGNVTNSGTSKIHAQHKGKKVEFAKRTKIAIDKIHADCGIATTSTVIVTPHGFIPDDKDDEKAYKAAHAADWFGEKVNVDEIIVTEDNSEWNESSKISPMIETDNDDEQDA